MPGPVSLSANPELPGSRPATADSHVTLGAYGDALAAEATTEAEKGSEETLLREAAWQKLAPQPRVCKMVPGDTLYAEPQITPRSPNPNPNQLVLTYPVSSLVSPLRSQVTPLTPLFPVHT